MTRLQVDPQREETVLNRVYSKDEIFIRNAEFVAEDSGKDLGVQVTCFVPSSKGYTVRPIPYVTAENYVRCLSQASYLLAENVLERELLPVSASLQTFLEVAANHELYYRNLTMNFHHRAARNEEFVLKLLIKNVRELKRLSTEYLLFTFTNERTVISGEMSFVYVNSA